MVTHVNSYAFYNKVVIALAPDKIEDYGKTFYLKTNPDYDQKKAPNEPMFICYYKDANGKEVDLPGGAYKEDGNNGQVLIAFFGQSRRESDRHSKDRNHYLLGVGGRGRLRTDLYLVSAGARYEERQKLAAHGGREKDKKKHNN